MQKVLLAGATGYLGKFVTRELKERGYWVRALARNPAKLGQTGPFLEPAVKDLVDDIFTGEVTRPGSLNGLCDGIDIVFSSIGITRQRNKLSFRDVDYQGNKNILDLALKASVKQFIFVSVFQADLLRHIPMVRVREDFVNELRQSGLNYSIIRPTGYFSDMTEFLNMANSGRVYLIGDGNKRMNPIHGADLAKVCADAIDIPQPEISVGGPETYTHNEIAELAFSVLGKHPRITRIPAGLVNALVKMLRPFSAHYYSLAAFFATAVQMDFAAPQTGTYTLAQYYREILPLLMRKMP